MTIGRVLMLAALLLPGCTWYTSAVLRPDGEIYLVGVYGFAGLYVPVIKRCAEERGRLACQDLPTDPREIRASMTVMPDDFNTPLSRRAPPRERADVPLRPVADDEPPRKAAAPPARP